MKFLTNIKQNLKMGIHTRLRQLILKENISVAKFEQEIGVGKNTISAILRMESSISHHILQKIHKRYGGFSVYWLLGSVKDTNAVMLDCIKELKMKTNNVYEEIEVKLKKLKSNK